MGMPLPPPLLFLPIVMVPEGVPPLLEFNSSLDPVTDACLDLGRVDPEAL